MVVVYTADTHTNREYLKQFFDKAAQHAADVVIIGGDIVPKELSKGATTDTILTRHRDWLEKSFYLALFNFKRVRDHVQVFLDFGNDDWRFNRSFLEEREGELFRLLHMRSHRISDDYHIIGYMNVPPTPFGIKDWEKADTDKDPTPGLMSSMKGFTSRSGRVEPYRIAIGNGNTIEADMQHLDTLAAKSRRFLFVSHCPPYGTNLDQLHGHVAVGSRAIGDFIRRWAAEGKIVAGLHGHIHESPRVSGHIIDGSLGVLTVNAGQNEFAARGGRGVRAVRFLLEDPAVSLTEI